MLWGLTAARSGGDAVLKGSALASELSEDVLGSKGGVPKSPDQDGEVQGPQQESVSEGSRVAAGLSKMQLGKHTLRNML